MLIRFSGTEPIMRVYCETTHQDKVQAILQDGLQVAGLRELNSCNFWSIPMKLTDTHCHLDLEQFDADRDAVIQRAIKAGLTRILVPSLTGTSSRVTVKLAESNPMLYAAVGVHPNEAESWDGQTISALKELAAQSLKVAAIGEIGLDYYWNKSTTAKNKSQSLRNN